MRFYKYILLLPAILFGSLNFVQGQPLTPEQLDFYLSRSITMSGLARAQFEDPQGYREDIRMLHDLEARFVGRVAHLWGGESRIIGRYPQTIAEAVSAISDSGRLDVVVQAAIFEIVTEEVNRIPIPPHVASLFGLDTLRNFRHADMLYTDGKYRNQWGQLLTPSVPDMGRIETQMWFYFLGTLYIDAGYRAIHFGQIKLMDDNDPGHVHWWKVLSMIREYAISKGSFMLMDAHTHGEFYLPAYAEAVLAATSGSVPDVQGFISDSSQLLFDFHSAPARPREISFDGANYRCTVGRPSPNAIYGDSKGGISPSGIFYESLPYLVELDNTGPLPQAKGVNYSADYLIWGWDEISWFSVLTDDYRRMWLVVAYYSIRSAGGDGYFQMPGRRDAFPTAEFSSGTIYRLAKADPAVREAVRYAWAQPDRFRDRNPVLELLRRVVE
jgi:hypothetical protein